MCIRDREYTVQNIMNNSMSAEIGAWWRIADHTAGNETGRFMVVNGFNPGAVFFRDVVSVQPNTNYLFTAWILNLFKVNGYPNPELGVRILDQNGGVLYSATLGTLIPVNVNAPEWKQIGSLINSQGNTSLTVEFLSEGPEVIGIDYAIDDISFNEILVPEFRPVKTVDRQNAAVGAVSYTHLDVYKRQSIIWVNGTEIFMAGHPGDSAEHTVPGVKNDLLAVVPQDGRIELVIQAANYHMNGSGIFYSLLIGRDKMCIRDSR